MRKDCSGFTLVETLIGSALLVVFISAIAVMTYSTSKMVGETKVKTVAANLAQEKLELARNMPMQMWVQWEEFQTG